MRIETIIKQEDDQRRAGRLAAQYFQLSAGDLSYLKLHNGLLANGQPVRLIDRIPSGTRLTAVLPEPQPDAHIPDPYLIYEDEAILVYDKPAGMPTMASARRTGDSLEEICSGTGIAFRPVNRLDKGTGGLMVCAATGYFQHRLSSQLHGDNFIREYLAVVEGEPDSSTGAIDLPIARADDAASKRCVAPEGKPSKTMYRVLRSENGRSLLRLRLLTGRTHQIRVHLSHLAHPICGDYLYGTPLPVCQDRFALHSTYLFIRHPVTGHRLFFRSDPPEWFWDLLDRRHGCCHTREQVL